MTITDDQKVQIFCAALSATAQTRGRRRGLDNDPVEEAFKLMEQAIERLGSRSPTAEESTSWSGDGSRKIDV